MSEERYVDPNSGLAHQPGGAFSPGNPQAQKEAQEIMESAEKLAQLREEGVAGEPEADSDAYDPGKSTVEDVLKYVEENPDQKAAVLQAEKDGKNRSTLVSQLEAEDE